MFQWLKRRRIRRVLRDYALPDELWLNTTRRLPLLQGLDAAEKARLRVLATLLIHRKRFSGVHGVVVNPGMQIVIAAQACLEVLNLQQGVDAFDGWTEIIVYPGAFLVERDEIDDIGVVHPGGRALSGEAWQRGPLILSWDDIDRDSFRINPGRNVVIHEFAHKLDMLNGRADGFPPLHPDMPIEEWTASLSQAYDDLVKRVAHHHSHINAYAATSPAEFFAVICEYFFTAPYVLHEEYPDVYDQLRAYFRQDPLIRTGHRA